jgi:CDP-diacylglycerol--glycerol-3-phosphate 3-phosphatidyltransferase
MKKNVANYITISRIVFSLALLFTTPLQSAFFVLYLLCGLSDFLDGYFARKFNTVSSLGSKLDTIADFIMFAVLIYLLYPILSLTKNFVIFLLIILIIKIMSILIVFIKYKTFFILHTYLSKTTGFLLFLFPYSIILFNSSAILYFICIIALLSALEELIIHIKSKFLNPNQKSIFK